MPTLLHPIGKTLFIGDDITLTVLEQDGDTIKLGIDAPGHFVIVDQDAANEPFCMDAILAEDGHSA